MKYPARFEVFWEHGGSKMFGGGVRYKWAAFMTWMASKQRPLQGQERG